MKIKKIQKKIKLIVVLGPTASGKSALAVRLAKIFKGEVISADSRQVYTGLDIGSGKITKKEMRGVPHHLLDVFSPAKTFTVANFQKLGQEKIEEIHARGHVPIICGGTGFYIQALVDSVVFPDVPRNLKLRATLEKKTTAELGQILKKIDARRFAEIDKNNRHRLIRAIEIAKTLGKVPAITKIENNYEPIFIGINPDKEELKKRIKKRLAARLRQGMVTEVKNLHKNGLSWRRLESFGLEYRAIAEFLRGNLRGNSQSKVTRAEMIEKLETNINQFAKRQMVWFKRDGRIRWFKPGEFSEIKKLVDLIDPQNKHKEIDWGGPARKEIW